MTRMGTGSLARQRAGALVALQRERVGLAVAPAQAAVHRAVVHVVHALHNLRMTLYWVAKYLQHGARCYRRHSRVPVLVAAQMMQWRMGKQEAPMRMILDDILSMRFSNAKTDLCMGGVRLGEPSQAAAHLRPEAAVGQPEGLLALPPLLGKLKVVRLLLGAAVLRAAQLPLPVVRASARRRIQPIRGRGLCALHGAAC